MMNWQIVFRTTTVLNDDAMKNLNLLFEAMTRIILSKFNFAAMKQLIFMYMYEIVLVHVENELARWK